MTAVRTRPVPVTNTLSALQVVDTVVRACRETFVHLLVDDVASRTLPTGFAVALAMDASSVFCTGGVFAVGLIAGFAFPTWFAVAGTTNTLAMTRTVSYTTVAFRDVAFWTFPAFFAVAEAATVLAVARTQNGTNTCGIKTNENLALFL